MRPSGATGHLNKRIVAKPSVTFSHRQVAADKRKVGGIKPCDTAEGSGSQAKSEAKLTSKQTLM